MKNITTAALLKKNISLLYNISKARKPNVKLKVIAGQLLQLTLSQKITKFDMTDYIRVSKKHRSNTVDVIIRDIFQYVFTGICIRHRKDIYDLNTSFLLRNVFDQFPYELQVPLYSPFIDSINVLLFRPKIQALIHSKYYYLRNKPLPMSKVLFAYIVGVSDPSILDKESHDYSDEENLEELIHQNWMC